MGAAEETERRLTEEARLQAEQERLQKEQERKNAEEAQKRKEAEEQKQREAQEDMNVANWLKQEKFDNVNHKRKSMMKSKCPLHSAVKRKEVVMIKTLLRNNADPSAKDSNNKTPKQLAEELNKDRSFSSIVQALS